MNEGAVISGTKGVAVRVNNGSQFIMNGGTITNNTTGVQVSGKDNFKGVEFIMNGGTISDNTFGVSYTVAGQSKVQLNGGTITGNGTNYQVSASGGSAQDEYEYLYIAPGILEGNTGVSVASYTVTLDEDYKAVYLGSASANARDALTASIEDQHNDWPIVGSSALWILSLYHEPSL